MAGGAESWVVTVCVETGEVLGIGGYRRRRPLAVEGPTNHHEDLFLGDRTAIRFTSWVSPEHAEEGAKAVAAAIRGWTVDEEGRRVAIAEGRA